MSSVHPLSPLFPPREVREVFAKNLPQYSEEVELRRVFLDAKVHQAFLNWINTHRSLLVYHYKLTFYTEPHPTGFAIKMAFKSLQKRVRAQPVLTEMQTAKLDAISWKKNESKEY